MEEQWGEFTPTIQGLLGYGDIDVYDPSSIASALSAQTNLDVTPEMLGALTPQMLASASKQTYQPIMELRQQSMLGDLSKGVGGKAMQQAMGGFAGAGASGQQVKSAKDVYGKSAADVMKEISQLTTGGRRGVMDVIQSWRGAVQGIKGS